MFRGPAPVPETWASLRGPKLDKTAPKTWAPIVGAHILRRKMGPFLKSWFWVWDFHPFLLPFTTQNKATVVQASHRVHIKFHSPKTSVCNWNSHAGGYLGPQRHYSNGGLPRSFHRQCLLRTTTANSHQSAAYDPMNVRTTRTQHH